MSCCDCKTDIARLEDMFNSMAQDLAPLVSGHPILMIQNADDIVAFDTNGNGTGDWIKWAVCDGGTHQGIITPDLRDRFVVGSGLSYNVNDIGGEATHVLTVAEMPTHDHAVTDPGHTHAVTDPGHTHAVTDPGHDHAASQVAHSHTGTTSTDGEHTHTPASDPGNGFVTSDNNGTFLDNSTGIEVNDSDDIAPNGDHSHTVTTDSQTPAVTVSSAFTGVSVSSNTTGVTVGTEETGLTIDENGSSVAHENRPPYYALIFVMKVA